MGSKYEKNMQKWVKNSFFQCIEEGVWVTPSTAAYSSIGGVLGELIYDRNTMYGYAYMVMGGCEEKNKNNEKKGKKWTIKEWKWKIPEVEPDIAEERQDSSNKYKY